MMISQVYEALGRYSATTMIRVQLSGNPELHTLTSCDLHRAKLQAILAAYGDRPYQMANDDRTGYVLERISGDDHGPILHMQIVPIRPEQVVVPRLDAN
jgi:hypothetical protein